MKSQTSPDAVADGPSPIRVLVVDDEPAVCRFAGRVLRGAGYVVETASNGPEALDIMENANAFDLFVIDEMMPDMRGRELASELRQRQPDAKVLYYTGNLDLLLQDTNVFVENEAVLAKPVSVDGLREAVARLLSDPTRDPPAR